ncbi:hypothetical protein HCG46_27750 [Labrenzia sp. PO1]|jgi:hypothetical protein|uniref:hypothetical protein n=1 Tax=Labrenzia sp. PO1 TaxID=2720390 RepID=UPI0014451F89|nr:hypothetical protein [Labrenzia sp. PO1]NKI62101.1 hypothetical protein [Labrenzia sp. PO1]
MNIRVSNRLAAGLAAGLCLSVVAGCNTSSNQTPTAGAVRSSGETAPTDLQLLCASKAAEELQVSGGNVLPVSSMPSGENAYQVNLTFDGGQAVCVIDEAGTVQSINRV